MKKTSSYNNQSPEALICKLDAVILQQQKEIDKLKVDMTKHKSKAEYLEKQIDNLNEQSKVFLEQMKESNTQFDKKMDIMQESINTYRIGFNDIKHQFEGVNANLKLYNKTFESFQDDYKARNETQDEINSKVKLWGTIAFLAFTILSPIVTVFLTNIITK